MSANWREAPPAPARSPFQRAIATGARLAAAGRRRGAAGLASRCGVRYCSTTPGCCGMSAFAIRNGWADGVLRPAFCPEGLPQALNRPGVQLRHARFVDANLRANLLHRCLTIIVEADHLALARRERGDRRTNAVAYFLLFVGLVWRLRLGRNQRGRERGAVDVDSRRERRRGVVGVVAD